MADDKAHDKTLFVSSWGRNFCKQVVNFLDHSEHVCIFDFASEISV